MTKTPPVPPSDDTETFWNGRPISRMSPQEFLALFDDDPSDPPLWDDAPAPIDTLQPEDDDPDVVFRHKVAVAADRADLDSSYGILPIIDLLTVDFATDADSDAKLQPLPAFLLNDGPGILNQGSGTAEPQPALLGTAVLSALMLDHRGDPKPWPRFGA